MLHQAPGWGAQTELSRDMGQKGAVLCPFLPLQLHVPLPLGSPPQLIAREKQQQEPHQKNFLLALLFPVASEQWKGTAEKGTGSLSSTAHVSPEICIPLLPTDHHSHILQSSTTPSSSFSSVAIIHC